MVSHSVPADLCAPPQDGQLYSECLHGPGAYSDLKQPIEGLLRQLTLPLGTVEYFSSLCALYGTSPIFLPVWDREKLRGIVLASERRFWGLRTGLVRLGNWGKCGWIGRECDQQLLADAALNALTSTPLIHTLFVSLRESVDVSLGDRVRARPGVRCEIRPVVVPSHLHLGFSYEEFLRRLGSTTRHNLRYYRRKGEAKGWRFVPDLAPDIIDPAVRHLIRRQRLSKFTAQGMLGVASTVHLMGQPLLCGLYSDDGEPLSVLIGWINGHHVHLVTQLNHGGPEFDRAALSTVVRAHLIEHLIWRGVRDLTVIGTCGGILRRYCVPERHSLAIIRQGIRSTLYSYVRSKLYCEPEV
jgi:hypothetical protein